MGDGCEPNLRSGSTMLAWTNSSTALAGRRS